MKHNKNLDYWQDVAHH